MSHIQDYFNRKYSEWNIIGFLNESSKEPFESKVDAYVKSLDNIIKRERGSKQGKARIRRQSQINRRSMLGGGSAEIS